jgi:high-affinity nickel-transport protein
MTVAYRWAFASPARKIYYNFTVTGLSVVVALGIGGVELLTVAHDKLHLRDPASTAVADLPLDAAGYVVAGLFVVVWAAALAYWRLTGVERRWSGSAG